MAMWRRSKSLSHAKHAKGKRVPGRLGPLAGGQTKSLDRKRQKNNPDAFFHRPSLQANKQRY